MRKRHLPHRYKEGERSAVFRFRNRRPQLGTPAAVRRHGRFFLPQGEDQSRCGSAAGHAAPLRHCVPDMQEAARGGTPPRALFCCLTAFGPNDETVMSVFGCAEVSSHMAEACISAMTKASDSKQNRHRLQCDVGSLSDFEIYCSQFFCAVRAIRDSAPVSAGFCLFSGFAGSARRFLRDIRTADADRRKHLRTG